MERGNVAVDNTYKSALHGNSEKYRLWVEICTQKAACHIAEPDKEKNLSPFLYHQCTGFYFPDGLSTVIARTVTRYWYSVSP